ncbi:MAG TPA: ABC transporter substrate-binding protein [Candidatus Tectomicrobia bacterium]
MLPSDGNRLDSMTQPRWGSSGPIGNPGHLEGIRNLEYTLDRAKALPREERAVGTAVKLLCPVNAAIPREMAQVVQDFWNTVGFNMTLEALDTVPWRNVRGEGTFDAAINGHPYRYDTEDYYARNLYSKSEYAQILSGDRTRTTISWWKRPVPSAARTHG